MDSCVGRSSSQTCASHSLLSLHLHHFFSWSSLAMLKKKNKQKEKKQTNKSKRKSNPECSNSSSVLGQIFAESHEKLWTSLVSSDHPARWDKAKWVHCCPCPTDLLTLQMLPWESFHSVEVSQAHQHGGTFACPCQWFTEGIFCAALESHLCPFDLPAACVAVWLSAVPSLASATCSPGLWTLPPPQEYMSGNLLLLAWYPGRPQLDGRAVFD